jgi:hypothetical protein
MVEVKPEGGPSDELGYRLGKVAEAVNPDPEGVDYGLASKPLLAFAACYVTAHLALDLVDKLPGPFDVTPHLVRHADSTVYRAKGYSFQPCKMLTARTRHRPGWLSCTRPRKVRHQYRPIPFRYSA